MIKRAFFLGLPIALLLTLVTDAAEQDSFDNYENESNLHGQGGWKGWDNDPDAAAFVSSDYALSPSQSVNVAGSSDLIRTFSGISSGLWSFRIMQYIPSTSTGNSYLILLNLYKDGGPYDWSVQIQNDMDTGTIISDNGGGAQLPMVKDTWVEYRFEINFAAGTVDEFYNNQLLSTHQWHDDTGVNELAALDLYANSATAVYYDDFSLQERWTAFNDCVDSDPASTPANATSYGLGRSYVGDGGSGNLVDIETGKDTGVTVTFTENATDASTINWATDPAGYTAGTDAEMVFGGKLNLTGNMSYNDAPGWSLDRTFSNLDPGAKYTFAGTVDRNGGDGYRNRITNWTITGARGAVFASSNGTHKVSEDSVEFSTGHNPEGLVARWTDISPAADGSFTIRTSHGIGEANGGLPGADAYRGYAGGVFMLEKQVSLESIPNSFVISSIDYDAVAATATITWPARSGNSYAVDFSVDLGEWNELDDSITADGSTANFTETDVPALPGQRYYRVRQR
jgi:hypothetical protein